MRLLFIFFLMLPLRQLMAQCNPPVTIDPIPTLCNGEPSYQLSAHPSGGVWSGPNISPSGLVSIYGLYGNRTATYTYSDSICTDTVQAFFQIIDAPSVNAGTDFSIVCGKTARVNGSFINGPHVYAYWSTPDGHLLDPPTDMNGRIDKPGTYILTAIDTVTGCAGRDTSICYPYLPSFPHNTIIDTICQGDSLLGYAASGVYFTKYAINGPCDSFRVVRLTVLQPLRDTLPAVICAGQSVGGYSQSGIYLDTFPAASGCDSIRTLQLTVLPTVGTQLQASTCDPTQAGVFSTVFAAANGCDSTVTTTVALLPVATSQIQQSICSGQTFEGYAQSGIYLDTFPAASGCDSIRTLQLTVLPPLGTQLQTSTCDPTQAGVFSAVLTATNGCDSTVTTTVTLLPGASSQIQQTICSGQTFEGYAQSGTYTDTFPAANGCDSIRTLQLTVLPAFNTEIPFFTCNPTEAGVFTAVFTTANGCDSTVTTTVTLLPGATSQIQQSICNGQTFEGYAQSGTYTDTFPAANGCDSIRTLQLTVLPLPTAEADIQPDKGTDNGEIELVSLSGALPLQFAWSTGDSTATLTGLSAGNYTLTLTDASGCSAVLTFIVQLSVGTSAPGQQTLRLSATPNPSLAGQPVQLRLQAPGSGAYRISMFSATGQLVSRFTQNHNGDQTIFPLELKLAGVYLVQVADEQGSSGVLRIIVW
ncbi:MAG: T9SS type A sorting domain-containing protein [Saprospiraceae bacterium]|nr:T9SS type A sorting domain-containing protein [Saprospiraceae bacterium]